MKETKSFDAAIYKVTGRHLLLTPDNNLKTGDLVIAFYPLKRIDPLNKFAYVVTADGTTESHTKAHLQLVKKVTVEWRREMFDTNYMEVRRQTQAMAIKLEDFIHSHAGAHTRTQKNSKPQ